MRKYIVLSLFILFSLSIRAQYIFKKVNFSLGYTGISYMGDKGFLNNPSSSPSLIGENIFSNSYCFGFTYNYSLLYSISFNIINSKFDSWEYSGDVNIFKRDPLHILSLRPGIDIHVPKRYFNKLDFFLSLSPTINRIKTKIDHEYNVQITDLGGNEIELINSFRVSNFYFGYDVSIGTNINLNRNYDIFLKGGYNQIIAYNDYFDENSFKGLYCQIGLNFRFLLNKRYNY